MNDVMLRSTENLEMVVFVAGMATTGGELMAETAGPPRPGLSPSRSAADGRFHLPGLTRRHSITRPK